MKFSLFKRTAALPQEAGYPVSGVLGTFYLDHGNGMTWTWLGDTGFSMEGRVIGGKALVATSRCLADVVRRLDDRFGVAVTVHAQASFSVVKAIDSLITRQGSSVFEHEDVNYFWQLLNEGRVVVSSEGLSGSLKGKQAEVLARWSAWSAQINPVIQPSNTPLCLVVDSYHDQIKYNGAWSWFASAGVFDVGMCKTTSARMTGLYGIRAALHAVPENTVATLLTHSTLLVESLDAARNEPWLPIGGNITSLPCEEERKLRLEIHEQLKARPITLKLTTVTNAVSFDAAARRRAKTYLKAYHNAPEVHLPARTFFGQDL